MFQNFCEVQSIIHSINVLMQLEFKTINLIFESSITLSLLVGTFSFSETQVGEKDEGRGCKRQIGHAGKRCYTMLPQGRVLNCKARISVILLKYFWFYHIEKMAVQWIVFCFIFISGFLSLAALVLNEKCSLFSTWEEKYDLLVEYFWDYSLILRNESSFQNFT